MMGRYSVIFSSFCCRRNRCLGWNRIHSAFSTLPSSSRWPQGRPKTAVNEEDLPGSSTSPVFTIGKIDCPVDAVSTDSKPKADEAPPSKWTSTSADVKERPLHYLQLSKSRLTLLVASTSAAGFAMAPFEVFEPKLLLASTIGVILTSSAANTTNQFLEVPFDSQMTRTRNRVLVRGLMTPSHALVFAFACAASGCAVLAHFVNPTAMCLALANIILYTCIYTPLKRASIVNTWVGSVVGAVPPLIGWTSATGGSLEPASFVLAAVLYAWQFPHFNALSWNIRSDYSKAGYRMMSVTHPGLCRRTALRYSAACVGICSVAAPVLQLTTLSFALESLPLNLYLTYLAWKFYRTPDSASSRKLFRFTLIHLPLLMTLMLIGKT